MPATHTRPLARYSDEAALSVKLERETSTGRNVIAKLPASKGEAAGYVMLGAHYDHLGFGQVGSRHASSEREVHNGADDIASGVAAVLQIA